jgi:hypothetical protein
MTMDFNVVLPFASSLLSLIFATLLIDQWRERRRPYQLVWAIGMVWYGLSAGTEWIGGAFGWSEPLYKAWYLIGAIWVAGWLGLGTVYLLGRTRFGFAFALSLFLAGLFTYLTQARYDYPDSGVAPIVCFTTAVALVVGVVWLTLRGDPRWPHLAGLAVVGGSVISAVLVITAALRSPGWVVDPVTHIPTGELFPGYIRLLTPFFNITGAFALTLGALYSAYIFMPKRRLIRYHLSAGRGLPASLRQLAIAPVAIMVNLVASIPLAAHALVNGTINSRVPATVLIAAGAIIPAITSGMNRFGATGGFFVGEFLGVLLLFVGFLVSIDVFASVRVPFTSVVVWRRHVPEASAND